VESGRERIPDRALGFARRGLHRPDFALYPEASSGKVLGVTDHPRQLKRKPALSSFAALCACAGVFVLIVSCGPTGGGQGIPQPTQRMAHITDADYEVIMNGYHLFQSRCTGCHSERVPKAPALGQPWHDKSLGLSLYDSFSDAERFSLIEYVKSVDKQYYSRSITPASEGGF
jgi:hypothetical protein